MTLGAWLSRLGWALLAKYLITARSCRQAVMGRGGSCWADPQLRDCVMRRAWVPQSPRHPAVLSPGPCHLALAALVVAVHVQIARNQRQSVLVGRQAAAASAQAPRRAESHHSMPTGWTALRVIIWTSCSWLAQQGRRLARAAAAAVAAEPGTDQAAATAAPGSGSGSSRTRSRQPQVQTKND